MTWDLKAYHSYLKMMANPMWTTADLPYLQGCQEGFRMALECFEENMLPDDAEKDGPKLVIRESL